MGKKKDKSEHGLGRAIIHHKFRHVKHLVDNPTNALHIMDSDPLAAREIKLRSVVEMNDLAELLTMAELADRDFTAERGASHVIVAGAAVDEAKKPPLPDHLHLLPIPKRPKWTPEMSAHEVDANEREQFVEWRRSLAMLEEKYSTILTPFEKNIEVWRQLWRVVERSDVLVQILDARNPLMYRCLDLELYVKSTGRHKQTVLVLNKADLLPDSYRKHWSDFLSSHGVEFMFFSAAVEQEILDAMPKEEEGKEKEESEDDEEEHAAAAASLITDRTKVLGADELLKRLSDLARRCNANAESLPAEATPTRPTIGFVGFPNVGKSSTLNVLCGKRRVAVGATPGKTKHFQTIMLSTGITLCDCPGLVFPSVVTSKAEMVCGGVLPIDELKDHSGPVQLVASRIPREVLELHYGIALPAPDPDHPTLAAPDLLQAHACARGFHSQHGLPDQARSARIILKDFVHGKLAFAHLPPGADPRIQEDMYQMMRQKTKMLQKLQAKPIDPTKKREATGAKFSNRVVVSLESNEEPIAPQGTAKPFAFVAGKKNRPKKGKMHPAEKAWARAESQGFTRPSLPLGMRPRYEVPE